MRETPVCARVLDEAIAWQLCLDSGEAGEREQARFQRWLAGNGEHARAWAQLTGIDRRLGTLDNLPARQALVRGARPSALRRGGKGLLGLLLVAALTLGLLDRQRPLSDWLADEVTARGEQREFLLPDRSRVRLNSRSALDVDFNTGQRRLFLRSGEIFVETAHGDDRPFLVQTEDGTLRALGTRFLVKREAAGTRLTVLQSAVGARPARAETERVVPEGQQVLMSGAALGASLAAPVGADAWRHGMLVVENVRLADLLEQLADYRSGYLGVDPAIADLRISGSFPLRDSERALAALTASLPVGIERHTRWWIRLVPLRDRPG